MVFPSEILTQQNLQNLNGAPFWVIRNVNIGWYYTKKEYDYFCYQVNYYKLDRYPTITTPKSNWHDGVFSMVFVRQYQPGSDPLSRLITDWNFGWAIGSYKDFQQACLLLKLTNKTFSPLIQLEQNKE